MAKHILLPIRLSEKKKCAIDCKLKQAVEMVEY